MCNINFPIDVVFLWVDGDDPIYRNAYESLNLKPLPRRAASDHGEIRQAVKSVVKFAPWVNQIFIVAMDGQIPNIDWPKNAKLIPHSQVFPKEFAHHLPTFNSQAITTHLHRVPNLSEHFICFNDDTFIGNDVTAEHFFSSDGKPKFFARYLRTLKKTWESSYLTTFLDSRLNNLIVLKKAKHVLGNYVEEPHHQALPLRRKFFEDCWSDPIIKEKFLDTSSSRVRASNNIVPTVLCLQLAQTKNLVTRGNINSQVIYLRDSGSISMPLFWLSALRPDLYCINDTMNFAGEERIKKLKQSLKNSLPHHRKFKLPRFIVKFYWFLRTWQKDRRLKKFAIKLSNIE